MRGDIYAQNGGLFGYVWGWRFVGTLHNVNVAGISTGCLTFNSQFTSPAQITPNQNAAVLFRCPTTVTTQTRTTLTTVTTVTNTIHQAVNRLNRSHSVSFEAIELLETQLTAESAARAELAARLASEEQKTARLVCLSLASLSHYLSGFLIQMPFPHQFQKYSYSDIGAIVYALS